MLSGMPAPSSRPRLQRPALSLLFAVAVALAACSAADDGEDERDGADPLELGQRYVEDRDFRRQVLLESFVDPTNGYATLRRARYALPDGTGWEALPEFLPPTRPVTVADLGRFADDPLRPSTAAEGLLEPLFDPATFTWSHDALVTLGRAAFERYPLQLDLHTGSMTDSAELAERYGLWRDARGHLGGLVRVALPDGTEAFAKTCATCHARPTEPGGPLVLGATNPDFDHGAIDHLRLSEQGIPPERLTTLLDWGPGQVDVTGDGVHNPTAITDLRPIRHQSRLHWAATLHNSLPALAVRIETLIITSHAEQRRPPRLVAFALAYYLWFEAGKGSAPDPDHPGAAIFERACGGCHQADGGTIGAVPVVAVGTDPAVARSPERGVGGGFYRVPSLWGVADRRQLLHHGAVHSLEELLDPARLERVPGHPFGTDLPSDDRARLLDFLATLGKPTPEP